MQRRAMKYIINTFWRNVVSLKSHSTKNCEKTINYFQFQIYEFINNSYFFLTNITSELFLALELKFPTQKAIKKLVKHYFAVIFVTVPYTLNN